MRISQAVAKNMIDAGIKGSIVNISSTISTVSYNNEVHAIIFVTMPIVYTYMAKNKVYIYLIPYNMILF